MGIGGMRKMREIREMRGAITNYQLPITNYQLPNDKCPITNA
ncbi:hypothetical protein [Tolypothrix sp. PCC 7712]|nr:hypothetical protein [Tolypothrix sp. PCC 7712]